MFTDERQGAGFKPAETNKKGRVAPAFSAYDRCFGEVYLP